MWGLFTIPAYTVSVSSHNLSLYQAGQRKRRLYSLEALHIQALPVPKVTERPSLTTRLQAAAIMGCRLWRPTSANPTNKGENASTYWALKSLSNKTESSQCTSGYTSDKDRPSRSANTDLGGQEQPALAATTPQAGADEPYHVFGIRMKWVIVAQIGVAGMFSGLSSNIYFPCLKTITQVS